MLSPKITTFCFSDIAVAAFLVEYVVPFVVSENLVEVEVASDTVDLAAGVTAAVIVAVAFDGVVLIMIILLVLLLMLLFLLAMLFFCRCCS